MQAVIRTVNTIPLSARSSIIQSYAVSANKIGSSLTSVKQTVVREAESTARRETKGQTDRDTSKVIQATTTTADAVKNVGFAPFARANVVQASLSYKKAVANLSPASHAKMVAAGFDINPQVVYKESSLTDITRGYSARAVAIEHHAGIIDGMNSKFLPAAKNLPVNDNAFVSDVSRQIKNFTLHEKMKGSDIVDTGHKFRDFNHNTKETFKQLLKNRNLKPDKDLEKLQEAADALAKAENKLQVMPKSLGMSVFRAATFVMQNSDTMKGYNLTSAAYRGLKAGDKFILTPALNISQNIGIGIYNKIQTAKVYKSLGYKPFMLKKAERQVANKKAASILEKKIVKKIPFKSLLQPNAIRRLPLRAIARVNNFAVNKIFKSTSTAAQTARTASDLLLRRARNQLTKAEFKTGMSVVKMGAKKAGGEAATKLAASKLGKSRAVQVFKKPFKVIGKGVKGVGKGVKFALKPVKAVANLIAKLMRKITEALAKVAKALGAVGAFMAKFIIGVVILMYALLGLTWLIDQIMNIFMMTDAEAYAKRAEIFYEQIEDRHEDMVEEIKEKCKEYSASDVEYINGVKENYKEVWCATSVMLQQDLLRFDTGRLSGDEKMFERLVSDNYENTHKITIRPYTYKEQDGTEREAVHIYVNILRDEALCYEPLALYPKAEEEYEENPSVVIDCTDWMSVVKGTSLAMSKINPTLRERAITHINVNGGRHQVRYDQSGFVSACLQLYNGISSSYYSNYELLTNTSISGFTRFNFSSWNNLKEGDILVSDKGCSIYAYTVGNIHYVYDGSRAGVMYSTCIPEDYTREYAIVWRPNDPGSVVIPFTYELNEDYDIQTYKPQFTNEPGYEEETGNEEGALIALKADLLDIAENPMYFDNDNYYFEESNMNEEGGFMGGGVDHMIYDDWDWSHACSASDFVRYMYSRHGVCLPFDDARALMDMGDMIAFDTSSDSISDSTIRLLQTGDLIWYLQKESSAYPLVWDYVQEYDIDIWTVYPDTEMTGEIGTSYEGSTIPIGKWVGHNAIPLIYIGNGQCVGYSANLLDETIPEEWHYNEAGVFVYNISKLEFNRVWYIHRPTGFTVKPIYGAENFFEGWTDLNIIEFMELYYDECWDTKSLDLSKHGEILDDSVDWSWYEEGTFLNSSNKWQYGFNRDHYSTWLNDLSEIVAKNYESYGMLPSVSFSIAYVLSGGRTSEESLLYFNIYEMLAEETVTDETKAVRLHHTEYDDEGNAIATYYNYRKYANYEDAWTDWFHQYSHTSEYREDFAGGRRSLEPDHWKYHDPIDNGIQFNGLVGLDVIDGKTRDSAVVVIDLDTSSKYIESDKYLTEEEKRQGFSTSWSHDFVSNSGRHGMKEALLWYDVYAQRRREAIENIEFLAYYVDQNGLDILALDGDPDWNTYNDYCLFIQDFMGELDRLEEIDNALGISTTKGEEAKRLANEYISLGQKHADDIYEKHIQYLKDHIPPRCEDYELIDEETGEVVLDEETEESIIVDGCVDDDNDGWCDNCTRNMDGSEDSLLDNIADALWVKHMIWISTPWDVHISGWEYTYSYIN